MKKRVISLVLATLLVFALAIPAFAVSPNPDGTNASHYLSAYGIGLIPESNCKMAIALNVDAVRTVTRVGVAELYIEQKVGGTWTEYDTLYGMDDPANFYAYNTANFSNTIRFTGTAGVQYRVTATVVAADSTGSDTGVITCIARTCHT